MENKDKKAVKKQAGNKTKKNNILFVCTGNTCRSAMAEYILKDILAKRRLKNKFNIISAGVAAIKNQDMTETAKKVLNDLGINNITHKSKMITDKMIEESELIVCMTAEHKRAICCDEKCKTIAELCGGQDVYDPYGGTEEDYKAVANYLIYAMDDVLNFFNKSVAK